MTADDITISLGLPSFRVTQQRVEPERYDIWVEPTVPGAVCPRCGQPSTAYHDSYERTVRDLPILGRPVYLHMLQRRFKCSSCGTPFNETSDVVDWQQRQTRRYQHYLTYPCRGSSIQEVSRTQHIGYRVVERLLYRQAHTQCDTLKRRLPTCVGIDEFAASITASATLYPFSLAHGASRWTEGSRRYLDGLQYRGKH